jgi:flagellar hook-associated protein 3 FlgL
MRISTAQMYMQGVDAIERQQSEMLRTQQQIATGRRILTPADDPVAAAQALTVSQSKDQNDQYASNIDTAKSALGLNDSVLAQVSDLLETVHSSAVAGGSGVLADSDRITISGDISARLQELLGLANSKDGNGRYLFSGFQTDTAPFVDGGSGSIVYNGDQGVRTLQVSAGRALPVSESGSAIFENVRNGNGTVATAAAGTNTGTGVAGAGVVLTPAAVNGDRYSIQFVVSAGVTTYDVFDATTSTTLSSGNAYTSGAAINVGGMQFSVSGAPASGDSFTLGPSSQQSMFTTLQRLVTALQVPVTGAADRARLANSIGQALQDVDQALNNVLLTRTAVGASLRELDSITSANQDRAQQYSQSLSTLQDLDYNKALSDFARQQLALDAAQKSFVKISGLSLFNYL